MDLIPEAGLLVQPHLSRSDHFVISVLASAGQRHLLWTVPGIVREGDVPGEHSGLGWSEGYFDGASGSRRYRLPQALFLATVASAKSPLIAMVEMSSVALPLLVRVTFFAALSPTTTLPHFSEAGERLTTGPPPPPVPASALIRSEPFGLPQPPQRS